MLRILIVAGMAFAVTACASEQTPINPLVDEQAALAEDGRDIAEAQCSGCHAVGPYGDSPNAAAPTFRTVLSQYHANVLEEELINGIRIAHPMPEFQFNPQGADALIAYLRSIQTPPPEPRR